MLDLHCHILPGVDDGAVDLADALDMVDAALATGCRGVCATSHLWEGLFGTSPELLVSEHARLVQELKDRGLPLQVFPGAENYLGPMSAEEFADKAVPLGPGGRYVLFDFSMRSVPPQVTDAVKALSRRGRTAVIAHPERNRELQSDPTPVAEWIEAGALIQVNGGSVLGWLGSSCHGTAEELLGAGAVHVIASDAHGVGQRRPFCLGEARERAAEIVGVEEAERLTSDRPWAISRGEDVDLEAPQLRPRKGKALWRRLWNG